MPAQDHSAVMSPQCLNAEIFYHNQEIMLHGSMPFKSFSNNRSRSSQQCRKEMASPDLTYQKLTEQHRDEIELVMTWLSPAWMSLSVTFPPVAMTALSFATLDPTSELWQDYWTDFQICMEPNSVPKEHQPRVLVTKQTRLYLSLSAPWQPKWKDTKR